MKLRAAPGFSLLVLIFLGAAGFIAAQTGEAANSPTWGIEGTDRDALSAREEFRLGVQAYNRSSFNEAILSFERALSYRPGEPLILDWLGRSYYRSGMEDTALRQWRSAVDAYGPSRNETLVLAGRIETVRNRRSLFSFLDEDIRYVEAGHFPGKVGDIQVYRQPTAVLPLEDGSVWVVAYGSNELVRIDVNGIVRQRQRGPLNGFDRPYDLVQGPDGRLYLSEFRGDRVSVLNSRGEWQFYIGSKGRGDGMFVGPQYITIDNEGYLYVVDYGNKRISKFDPDGSFILSFGDRSSGFTGFISPTGIAALEGRVYVADNITRQIYIFDRNGGYLGILVTEGLRSPESLSPLPDGRLLVTDANRLLIIDPNSALIREMGLLGNTRVRIAGAKPDLNGNILAANFEGNEVSIMTPLDDMAAGLFVQIERVNSDSFPLITVDLQVQDRRRRPIIGLDSRNFVLSEQGRLAGEQNFLGAGYRSETSDLALLLDRSPAALSLGPDLNVAIRDIHAAGGHIVSLIAAGEQPLRQRVEGTAPSVTALAASARGTAASYTPRWRFDLGLRLAATDLLNGQRKRAVVFISSGEMGELAFDQYGLSELAAYLANNNIIFYTVILGGAQAPEELRYLCEQTGGDILPLYRPEGISPVLSRLGSRPSGSYTLSYRSSLPTDFGRAYLPVEAEVYLLERSGRDATGYFPPME
ncbi:NHL repeat-containing protein [Treponema primitia]|uniref:NHL repeat-containing protein n=1 Tax=Treponema primitia TaxID=88058 RepID=UPI0002D41CE3|nr:NHL repeat-containing protein [Treponema primitia]